MYFLLRNVRYFRMKDGLSLINARAFETETDGSVYTVFIPLCDVGATPNNEV